MLPKLLRYAQYGEETMVREGEHARVAVVDDDSSTRTALARLLQLAEFDVQTFSSADQLLNSPARFHCVVIDVHLSGLSGTGLHAALRNAGREVPVVLITGHDTPSAEEYARAVGVPYLRKPVLARDLLSAVQLAISRGNEATGLQEKQRT